MGSPLKIKEDRTPAELRRLARRERGGRIAARLYAIANALDGMSRAAAAQLAGMERQALRDAVLRYNTEDLAGLRDHPKGRPQRRLTEGEEAALAAVIPRGPEPDRDGCCAWTRGDLCRWIAAHFGKSYHPSSMTRVLRRMGFSRQKARPAHPKRDHDRPAGPAQQLGDLALYDRHGSVHKRLSLGSSVRGARPCLVISTMRDLALRRAMLTECRAGTALGKSVVSPRCLLQYPVVECQIRHRTTQPGVLRFQVLQPLHLLASSIRRTPDARNNTSPR